MRSKIIFLIISMVNLLLCGIVQTFAEPSITNVSGTLNHSGSIIINGSGFGSKSPAPPLIWDDCENRTLNSPSAVESEGGWTDAKPMSTSWPRTEEDADYFEIQYRADGFRNVIVPHNRSSNFVAGSHSLYREYNPHSMYNWIVSGIGTNEYYLADASIPQSGNYLPNKVRLDGTSCRWGTIGSLADHQVGWGDNDSLGYNTIYLRDDSGDPDSTNVPIYVGSLIISYTYNMGLKIYTGGTSYQTWFVSFYTTLDPLWPQTADGNSSNHKLINFDRNCSTQTVFCGTQQYYFSHPYNYQPTDGKSNVGMASHNAHCGDDVNPAPEGTVFSNYIYTDQTSWQKWEVELDYSDSNDFRNVYINNAIVNWADGCDINDTFDGVSIGTYWCYEDGYWNDNGTERAVSCTSSQNYRDTHYNTFRYYDDIYVDTTLARVILADNSTYSDALIIEPQIPSEWDSNGNSITCTVNLGKLPDSGTVYLFVFDADNNHNHTGYPVAISGGSEGDNLPPTTSGHSPPKETTGFYANSNIIVHVQDNGDGVDQSSIVMTVNGQTVSPNISGTPSDYTLTYDPLMSFSAGETIIVTIRAQDLHNPANVMPEETYSFSVADLRIRRP